MRNSFFYIITVLIISCSTGTSTKNKDEEKQDRLTAATNEAIKSDELIKKVFLDIEFGMTENEVNKHLRNLVKDKKLYISSNNLYTYDFNTSLGVIKSTLGADYYNGKLFRFTLKFNPIGVIDNPIALMGEAKKVFEQKATTEGYQVYFSKDPLDKHQITYIKDNMIVEFSCTIDARMTYTNAPIIKLLELEENQKIESTASDL